MRIGLDHLGEVVGGAREREGVFGGEGASFVGAVEGLFVARVWGTFK